MHALPEPLKTYLESPEVERHGFPTWVIVCALVTFAIGIATMEKWGKPTDVSDA